MKISVALCTYNGEKYVHEQIDSILNQSYKVDEIIVCDDISSDNTLNILNKYQKDYPNIFKIYVNDKNLRSVKNFEKAISLCTGDIIFLSDQDDVWTENKVEHYKNYFEKHQNINVIASNGFCINDFGEEKPKYAIWDVPFFLSEVQSEIPLKNIISHITNIATGATMALKRSFLPEIMPFPEIKSFHHDEWIAIIAAHQNSFVLLQEKYFYYRIHEKQQVGGVFFEKNTNEKQKLTETFDINNKNIAFASYKKRLKRFQVAYSRNLLLKNYKTKHNIIFENNLVEIEKLFLLTQINVKKLYPIKAALLNISDKIMHKRQLQ